jgi:3-oxoacyl-[acyl-carrier protein] reductase
MEDDMKLKNKVALVTGGSSGFGEAFCKRFALEGARLVVADIDDANGERVAQEIADKGGEAFFVHADVSVANDVETLVAACAERYDGLDILMNNAGIGSARASVVDMTEAQFDRIFSINVKSIFLLTHHAVPLMRTGGGVIINTASTSAIRPRPLISAYSASKSAVITLTKAYALELAEDKIRVNALAPVAADTPLFRDYLNGDQELLERTESAIPVGRLCHPDDMSAAALFLCSDEAQFLTGVCLPVDGGWTAG